MMNRLNKHCRLLVIPTLLLLASSAAVGQVTVFFTGFEYDLEPIVFGPIDLNGAKDQVGTWSGDEFPEGIGDALPPPDSVGFANNPYGGTVMLLDQPAGDATLTRPNVEENGNFTGSFFADFTEPVLLLGTQVSFDVGTRRTRGNADHGKDYNIIGRDSNGQESFHLRVSARSNTAPEQERLGVVTDAGATVTWDLPTTVGEDKDRDLNGTGGPPAGSEFPDLFIENDEIGSIQLFLFADGYIIDFTHNPLNTTARFNAYTTDVIPYNGLGTDLAQLEFTYEASDATGRNSGYLLDNILVIGRTELLLGDFNFDGSINMADFQVLASNFNTGTEYDQGDNNFDGIVNLKDFVEFKLIFIGQGVAAAVPEPSSVSIVGLAAVLLLRLRRRGKR